MDDNGKTKTVFGFVATRPKDLTAVFVMVVVTIYNFVRKQNARTEMCAELVTSY